MRKSLYNVCSLHGYFNSAYKFHCTFAKFHMDEKECPVIKIMCLPISKEDETTDVGTGILINKFLKQACLLVENVSVVEPKFIVAPVASSKYLIFTGDGLSHLQYC